MRVILDYMGQPASVPAKYPDAASRFRRAFEAMANVDADLIPVGRWNIEGDAIYANVMEYETIPHDKGRWESHRKYADIQWMIKGRELMAVRNILGLAIETEYDAEKDVMFWQGGPSLGQLQTIEEGRCIIFGPEDGHMPMLAVDGVAKPVRKIVVKVLL